jgi:hypothetical protein
MRPVTRKRILAEDVRAKMAVLQENVLKACAKSGRKSEEVRILIVTRGRTVPEIRELVDAGCRLFGENRVQEGIQKLSFFEPDIEWHLVGHLQSVKAKAAIQSFALIHTVDSLRIGFDLQSAYEKLGRETNILVQVNTSGIDTPFGVLPSETMNLIRELVKFPHVNIKGLMVDVPQVDEPEMTRPWFRSLRDLRDKIRKAAIKGVEMQWLSMGTSQDYVVAVEEGSNIIRITSPIFEEE